jgi:hypothetical protein
MPTAKKKVVKKKSTKINKNSEIKALEKKIDILYNRLLFNDFFLSSRHI